MGSGAKLGLLGFIGFRVFGFTGNSDNLAKLHLRLVRLTKDLRFGL